jgi:hypothetical protein
MVSLSGLNQHRLAQRRAGQGAVDQRRARTEQEGGEMRGEVCLVVVVLTSRTSACSPTSKAVLTTRLYSSKPGRSPAPKPAAAALLPAMLRLPAALLAPRLLPPVLLLPRCAPRPPAAAAAVCCSTCCRPSEWNGSGIAAPDGRPNPTAARCPTDRVVRSGGSSQVETA